MKVITALFNHKQAVLIILIAGMITAVALRHAPRAAQAAPTGTPNNLCFNIYPPIIVAGEGGAPPEDTGAAGAVPHTYEPCQGFPDFNGDGYADLAIGAPDEDVTQGATYVNAGAVHVIYGTAQGLEAQAAIALQDDQIWHRAVAGLDVIAVGDGDAFGQALAVGNFNNDRYDDLAIGVPGSAVSGILSAGAVQILYGSADGLTVEGAQVWTQESGSIEDDAGAGDAYGHSLSSGDYNQDGYGDLAVGVPGETVNGDAAAGAVNIIYGSDGGLKSSIISGGKHDELLTQDTVEFFTSAEPNDQFGTTLTTGDFNNDGMDDLAVGTPYEEIAGLASAGTVQVFFGSALGVAENMPDIYPQEINAGTPGVDNGQEANDRFGFALSAADFNRDGFDDLAVGTPYETHGAGPGALSYAGAVNIVFGAASGLDPAAGAPIWHQDVAGMDSEAAANEFFGWSLEAADFDNDGYADLAIGVPQDRVLGVQIGAVHVLYGSNTGLSAEGDTLIFDPGNPAAKDEFGIAITAIDANGDSTIDLVVGARDDDPVDLAEVNPGSVFIFYSDKDGVSQTNNQNWYQNHNGLAGAPETNDRFGTSLP